ncbi:hypothetical protein DPMN_107844 [Dreissena polymorpha]|uniref:Uncharacterized protein n=1 Tax=Dreissena polymorpha TaxID=45954 RepID=A0A9D4K7M8_DREPO|nr:hypothetical protein DPMN_107844 [Dreissena polymorpha]
MTPSQSHCCGINSYEAVSNSLPLNSMSSALQQAMNHSLTKGRVPLGHFSYKIIKCII